MEKVLISLMPFVAASLFAAAVTVMGARHPPQKVLGGVKVFMGMVEERTKSKGLLLNLKCFCDRNGASFHYGKKITPVKLMLISLFLFSIGFVVGIRLSVLLAGLAGVLLAALPWVLLPILNRADNEKMLPDLQSVYHGLAVQIRAGVHVSDALSEMYTCIGNERLRSAFMNLGSDIILKSDMFSALEKFQLMFDNRYIDSFCITILQSMESGRAGELLKDIGDQMKDMQKAVLEKKKGRLDRSLTFYQLGMLACVLAVALYACVNYMLAQAVSIG